MAKFDSKSFNPQAFGKYVDRIPNVTKNELAKSGAVGTNQNAHDALANQTGSLYARVAKVIKRTPVGDYPMETMDLTSNVKG